MSLRKCATIKCPRQVRKGLRRNGTGVDCKMGRQLPVMEDVVADPESDAQVSP